MVPSVRNKKLAPLFLPDSNVRGLSFHMRQRLQVSVTLHFNKMGNELKIEEIQWPDLLEQAFGKY